MSETTQAQWDNVDKTCYRIEFLEGWSWQCFKDIHLESYAMLGKIDRHIDLIVVFLGKVPESSSLGFLSAGGEQPPNIRHSVMVNATDLVTKLFMQSMVDSVVESHDWVGPKFVDSVEEARHYLADLKTKTQE